MEKYYTPTEDDFHKGFEFEVLVEAVKGWREFYIRDGKHLDFILKELEHGRVRVKFLDSEDVEELSFKKRLKDEWIGWHDYIAEITNPEYDYYNKVTLHTPRMGDLYKIYVHRHLRNEDDKIENQVYEGESELVYKGLIKNKSELKKLTKQLGLCKNK